MNFKNSELSKWYNTKAGIINAKEIIKAVDKILSVDVNKNILYFGEYSIVKKILRRIKVSIAIILVYQKRVMSALI